MFLVAKALIVVSSIFAALAGTDGATRGGLKTELLGRGKTTRRLGLHVADVETESIGALDLVVLRVTFAPGATTGWQCHPDPAIVIVTRGSLTRYSANNGNAQTFTSGHTFVENDPKDGNLVRNEGTFDAEAIVVLATRTAAPAHDTLSQPQYHD
jgi:quercetin dioxygenase-like cupin family protein